MAPEGPFEGCGLPLVAGDAKLVALPEVARASVAPFSGQLEAASATLRGRTGTGLPAAGRAEDAVVWAGAGLWLVEGYAPADVAGWLAGRAAVADQSDGWAGMRLTGPAAADVLARLVPLDLDPGSFPPGAAARSLLRHAPLLLVARDAALDLLVPRSFAATAVNEIGAAMRRVAARGSLTAGRERL
jgi:sarcosine oxidase subunit gamma